MLRFLKKRHASGDPHERARRTALQDVPDDAALVRVRGPEDGACVCGDWLGAVVSVSGDSAEYPSLDDAIADGLFHDGCRHRLAPFAESEASPESTLATALAVAAMERRRDGEPTPADRAYLRDEFERAYRAAHDADRAGDPSASRRHCESALRVLETADLYGAEQPAVERTLRARIQTIARGGPGAG